MQATIQQEHIDTDRYARTVAASKRVRWSIEEDVIRNRTFDTRQKFLPDGLSKVKEFTFLSDGEQRYLSQIQGRTYANIFGLVERYINAKVLETQPRSLVRRPDRAGGACAVQRRGIEASGTVPAHREARCAKQCRPAIGSRRSRTR